MPDRPSVFDYLDHRRYLADWFAWKKQANPRFSHRAFARAARQKSPSLALSVIQGKRNLTEETQASFASAMKLTEEEAEFFRMLWAFDMARTDEERDAAWRRIASTRHFRKARPVQGASYRYLSTWYLPAIRELASCPRFRPDPAWIATTLRPAITAEQASDALDVLQELGMLALHDDGTVELRDASLATPHEVAGLAVHNYHREMLARARESITEMKPDERHLSAITVAVPAALLSELKQHIGTFLQDMMERCDASEDPPEQVLQLGVQLTPLSHPISDSERP